MRTCFSLLLIGLISCTADPESQPEIFSAEVESEKPDEPAGERIDGPANVRETPNGELVFELMDNAVIETTSPVDNWVRIGIFTSFTETQKQAGMLKAGDDLVNAEGTRIGKILKDQPLIIYNPDDDIGYVEGMTHVDNIRPETLVENDVKATLSEKGRTLSDFKHLIEKYDMEKRNDFLDFEGYGFYENMVVDPSPGYRVLLLFKENHLKGFYHTRAFNLPNTDSYSMNRYEDSVTFFNDYPATEQMEFVDFMRDWLQGVD